MIVLEINCLKVTSRGDNLGSLLILGHLYIFKVVQHVEVWTSINFLVS
jgi:hypothetical protein